MYMLTIIFAICLFWRVYKLIIWYKIQHFIVEWDSKHRAHGLQKSKHCSPNCCKSTFLWLGLKQFPTFFFSKLQQPLFSKLHTGAACEARIPKKWGSTHAGYVPGRGTVPVLVWYVPINMPFFPVGGYDFGYGWVPSSEKWKLGSKRLNHDIDFFKINIRVPAPISRLLLFPPPSFRFCAVCSSS